MKRLLVAAAILIGSLAATSTQAQVRVHGNIGFGTPVYSQPPVIYQPSYPVYNDGYRRVVVVDRDRRACDRDDFYGYGNDYRFKHHGRGYYKNHDRDDYRGYDRDDRYRRYDRDDRYNRRDHDDRDEDDDHDGRRY